MKFTIQLLFALNIACQAADDKVKSEKGSEKLHLTCDIDKPIKKDSLQKYMCVYSSNKLRKCKKKAFAYGKNPCIRT